MTLGTAPCGIASDVWLEEVGEIANLAIDLGISFIDTALTYGKSQEGIGRALGSRRKDVGLASKVMANTIAEAETSLANSLKTLKTDYVDILCYHHPGNRQPGRALRRATAPERGIRGALPATVCVRERPLAQAGQGNGRPVGRPFRAGDLGAKHVTPVVLPYFTMVPQRLTDGREKAHFCGNG
jgi:hypothetical protein